MAGTPAEPPDSSQASTGGRKHEGGPARDEERAGPVAIARHVKDDGRALILYARDRPYQA